MQTAVKVNVEIVATTTPRLCQEDLLIHETPDETVMGAQDTQKFNLSPTEGYINSSTHPSMVPLQARCSIRFQTETLVLGWSFDPRLQSFIMKLNSIFVAAALACGVLARPFSDIKYYIRDLDFGEVGARELYDINYPREFYEELYARGGKTGKEKASKKKAKKKDGKKGKRRQKTEAKAQAKLPHAGADSFS